MSFFYTLFNIELAVYVFAKGKSGAKSEQLNEVRKTGC